MPVSSLESLTADNRESSVRYVPGYDWIPGRFGPPPGIPKALKDQLDRMSDRDYHKAVLKLSQEERESLMISEAERRRTFRSAWAKQSVVKANDLAKEGFYFTGVSDRVQCAFCLYVHDNWKFGDVPNIIHRNFSGTCSMVQGRPTPNIPYDNTELPDELRTVCLCHTNRTSLHNHIDEITQELQINTGSPQHRAYQIPSNRLNTYRHYSRSYPMSPEELSDAGFYYEGPGDKVRCFWCDGALELWVEGDSAWTEHAKWYPGCSFVRNCKGVDFIRSARREMSGDDVEVANTLHYTHGDMRFLEEVDVSQPETIDITAYDSYNVCLSLNFDRRKIEQCFEANNRQDFSNIQSLIDALNALEKGDTAKLDDVIRIERSLQCAEDPPPTGDTASRDQIDIDKFLKEEKDPTEEESEQIVAMLTCRQCLQKPVEAVVMPCGHLNICQQCSRALPLNCLTCHQVVKGSCRAYLS